MCSIVAIWLIHVDTLTSNNISLQLVKMFYIFNKMLLSRCVTISETLKKIYSTIKNISKELQIHSIFQNATFFIKSVFEIGTTQY